MARKALVNCLQVIGVTGVSMTTNNTLTTGGNSQEFYEFATADAVRFYLDVSAFTGSNITFDLYERDPATGVFFKNNPASDPLFGAAVSGTTSTPKVTTIDPCYGEAYQIFWSGTFSSVTCSLVAQVIYRT